MVKQLKIDWTRCDGHGLCALVFPGAIASDEWGFPLIRSSVVRDADLPHARRAVALCPSLALRLETADRSSMGRRG